MSKMSYALGDQLRRLRTWLTWNPFRLVVFLSLILVLWLVLAGQSAREKDGLSPEPTAATSSGLPNGWETWPKTTATLR